MSTEFLVKFFGLLLGVLARTILPWLRKVREGKVRGFSRRYLYSALAFGFGFNALLNEGGAWASKPGAVETAPGAAGRPPR